MAKRLADRRKVLAAQWEKGGDNQLAKCAESLALRKAFPMDLSGLYSTEEMEHLDIDSAPRAPRSPKPGLRPGTRSAQRDPLPGQAPAAGESTTGDGAAVDGDHPEATGAPARTVPGPDSGEVELFPCSRCGEPLVEDEGGICERCEIEIEVELTAEEES